MRTDDQFPVSHLQHLLGVDNALCFRRAKAGKYGEITKDARGRQCVSLQRAQIEEARTFSEEEIERALKTPSTPKRKAAPKSRSVDFGLQKMIATVRDLEWVDALRAAGYDLTNVRVVPFMDRPVSLDGQEVFSRNDVRELIDSALEDRDSEWKDWLRNSLARAQHRSGPPKQWSSK